MIAGEGLAERPLPDHVPERPCDATIPGRWVDAGDLREGDLLLLRDGRRGTIEALSSRHTSEPVYNFAVAELSCYAVGSAQALVHNNSGGQLPDGFIKAAAEARQKVEAGTLTDFSPETGSGRSPGHARSSHGFTDVNDPIILDLRNNPDRVYVGQNSDGSKVVVFWKDDTVVITDAANTQSVITAYGKNAPGRTNNPSTPRSDIWAADSNYHRIKG